MILVLLGPPASGKGTLAQSLVEKGWKSFSAGDALRDAAKGTGKKARVIIAYLKVGRLVPNKWVEDLEESFYRANRSKKMLLDGTPRNVEQAVQMEKALKKDGLEFTAFLLFDVSKETSWKRIRSRMQCGKCKRIYGFQMKPKKKGICNACGGKLVHRSDDSKKVLHARFKVYEKETLPLVEWAAERYPVFYINANRSPQVALKQVKRAISVLQSK
jgi:adenylate kinase